MVKPLSLPAHVAYLDSMRGLAALMVIGAHYVNSYDLPCRSDLCNILLTDMPLHLWWDGGAAVSLFFVLSGLVLSLRYFRHGASADLSIVSLAKYFIGRVCRIWPPYLVVLSVSALLYQRYQTVASSLPVTIPEQNDWLPYLWGHEAGWREFFQDSFLLGMRMEMVYLPQAWTLSIELVLSLLVPLGGFLATRSTPRLILFTIFAIMFLHASPFLFHFMLGILIAKYQERLGSRLRTKTLYRRCIFVLGLILYTLGESFTDKINPVLIGCLTGLGAALLILVAFGSLRMQQVLSLSWFRYIGKISYSIYLVHFAVLISATPMFLSALHASPDWFVCAWWMGFAANIAISIFIAAFSYRFVEVPSMALGKYLGRKIHP